MLVLLRRTSFLTTFYGLYFSSTVYTCYKFPYGPLRAASILLLLTANIKACIINPQARRSALGIATGGFPPPPRTIDIPYLMGFDPPIAEGPIYWMRKVDALTIQATTALYLYISLSPISFLLYLSHFFLKLFYLVLMVMFFPSSAPLLHVKPLA